MPVSFRASSPNTETYTVASRRSFPHLTPVTVKSPGATESPCITENIASAITRFRSEFTLSSLSTPMANIISQQKAVVSPYLQFANPILSP